MMRATASTQVCLDWWPGRDGLEQWEVLLLAGPFLAATVCDSGRLATWIAVDPGRTAFDGRLVHGNDPVAAYTDLAAGAQVFVDGGPAEHLTTLFPPVRPRAGYLEVRFPDAQPVDRVEQLVAGLAALLYDDERRRAALDSLRGERDRLADLWHSAAAGTLCPARGRSLLGLFEEVAA
jgi:glutamate--cysteine ligase